MSGILFEDMFVVESTDMGRYTKVARIVANSSTSKDIKITLDINNELFPVKQNDSLTIALSSSLGNEKSMLTSNGSWRPPRADDKTHSLADDYDYVMYGTIYKFEENEDNDKMSVYISFGGLLMRLEGGYRSLSNLKQENAYILVRQYKDN
ncbi:16-kDa RNA polymerase subunit [Scheffersomyces coipomensis]|uniref:16-kDa RNA polymerase subunit n=1 Tax=Scheffersomyces coipomensis TaxID=1788519 RepID=UPI00315D8E6E